MVSTSKLLLPAIVDSDLERFTAEDDIAVERVPFSQATALTRDGRYLAIPVLDPQRKREPGEVKYAQVTGNGTPAYYQGAGIVVVDTVAATVVARLNDGSNWDPAWSPDGRTLAFASDRDGNPRIWLWDRVTKSLRCLTEAVYFTFQGQPERISWLPDGRRLLVRSIPKGSSLQAHLSLVREHLAYPEGAFVIESRSVQSDASGMYARGLRDHRAYSGDLVLVDVDQGKARYLTDGLAIYRSLVSPDGTQAAVFSCKPAWKYDQVGVRTESWTTWRVVHVFIRRSASSGAPLPETGQASQVDDSAAGLPDEERSEELVSRV